MKIHRRISALLTALLLVLTVCSAALAHDIPDMTRRGSISFRMECEGSAVPGGTLTLYRVGAVGSSDGDYAFVLTQEFSGSGKLLRDVSSPELAAELAAYAEENGIAGTDIVIGSDGTAKAENLRLGLYLVVQSAAAEGYSSAAPFLVSVPMFSGSLYVYDVDAAPKMSAVTKNPEESPVPSEPVVPSYPDEPVEPIEPTDPTLPQTGQLNWPIPVLTVLGLCLLLIGFYLRGGSKERSA